MRRGRRYGGRVSIARKSNRPAGITNASGQPEIELSIGDLKFTAAPPAKPDEPNAKPAASAPEVHGLEPDGQS